MKTSDYVGELVYKHIMESDIPPFISGEVWKGTRPDDSILEDIVVNPRTIGRGSVQEAFCDILIFVSDIEYTGKHFIADSKRLGDISDKVVAVFEQLHRPTYTIQIQSNEAGTQVTGKQQHYSFFRLFIQIYNV